MRRLATVLVLVFLASPVCAQDLGRPGGRGGGKGRPSQSAEQQKADLQKKKAAEDAYNAGIKRIPDAKEKVDPWKNAR